MQKKYLPSKNFLIALSIGALIVIASLGLSYIKSKNPEKKLNNNNLAAESDSNTNWQADLLANASTSALDFAYQQKYQQEFNSLNATQKLARNLISNIIAAQPVHSVMDASTTDLLAQKTLDGIPANSFQGKTQLSGLFLIPVSTTTIISDLRTYVTGYYKATETLRPILDTDLALVNTYLSTNATPDKKGMTSIIVKYQDIINTLKKLPIPYFEDSAVAAYHLAIINDLEKIIAIDNDIINSGQDIINIFSDVNAHNETMSDLVSNIDTIDRLFNIKRT